MSDKSAMATTGTPATPAQDPAGGEDNKPKENAELKVSEEAIGGTCAVRCIKRVYEDGGFKIKEATEDEKEKVAGEHDSFALVCTENHDRNNEPTTKTLRINSPHILEALETAVQYYPAHTQGWKDPVDIESPFVLLYHHYSQLTQRKEDAELDPETRGHLGLLIAFLDNEPHAKALSGLKQNLVTFDHLWAAFPPGSLVFTVEHGHKRLYWLRKAAYRIHPQQEFFSLEVSHHAFNGRDYGRVDTELHIHRDTDLPGDAAVLVTNLSVSPLSRHPNHKKIQDECATRGRDYPNYTSRKVYDYDALCLRPIVQSDNSLRNLQDVWEPLGSRSHTEWAPQMVGSRAGYGTSTFELCPLTRSKATGRVFVDVKTFMEDHPLQMPVVRGWTGELVGGPDNPTILSPPFVHGYYLNMRCWCRLFISHLKKAKFNKAALESVLLPDGYHEVLKPMVKSHAFETEAARDESKLKGKGLVFVLYGPPGTGKTCTAEAIAESTEKPLLIFRTGELGNGLSNIQNNLQRLVRYATTWKAILLIDEADIFLESREGGGGGSLERNALLAVFLRQLEYFHGIIFLTSNRADRFDAAVLSRVNIMLHYEAPNTAIRRQLWERKLKLVVDKGQEPRLDIATAAAKLEKYEMNGREISNSILAAKTMAASRHKPITEKDLLAVADLWKKTQAHLQGGDGLGRGETTSEPGTISGSPQSPDQLALLSPLPPWLRRLVALSVMGAVVDGVLRLSYVGLKALMERWFRRR